MAIDIRKQPLPKGDIHDLKEFQVVVTESHMADGCAGQTRHCAFAMALLTRLVNFPIDHVEVNGADNIDVYLRPEGWGADSPVEVVTFEQKVTHPTLDDDGNFLPHNDPVFLDDFIQWYDIVFDDKHPHYNGEGAQIRQEKLDKYAKQYGDLNREHVFTLVPVTDDDIDPYARYC